MTKPLSSTLTTNPDGARRDRAASFSLVLWTVDPVHGLPMIFDILEPKARYASAIWANVRRHAIAGRITRVDVCMGGPSGPVVRSIPALVVAGHESGARVGAFGLLALAAGLRHGLHWTAGDLRATALRDARLILADLRQSRAATCAPMGSV